MDQNFPGKETQKSLPEAKLFLMLSYRKENLTRKASEKQKAMGGFIVSLRFDDETNIAGIHLKEQGITEYQEWVIFPSYL